MTELEEVSYEQFVKFNEECYGTSEYALPNARELATWNACLARMTPIIEQRVRERLAKLARSEDGYTSPILYHDEILAGKLED